MKKLWKWLFGTRNEQCNINDVTISCEPKTPIIATNVSYSNGRFRRYVNFTCPKCNKERSEAVWSDMEHIDPDTYDCECGEVLKIWVKEHITTLGGCKIYMGCSK